jgi:hypothetical protein
VNIADADTEYFKCFVGAGVRRESVETILTQVFGESIRRLMTELPALVERLAMPVLDLARDLRGLDVVMNDPSRFPFALSLHPLSPQNLADLMVNFGRRVLAYLRSV